MPIPLYCPLLRAPCDDRCAWRVGLDCAVLPREAARVRPLPADEAAERRLIGGVLLHPDVLPRAGEIDEGDFFSPAHRRVWAAIRRQGDAATALAVGTKARIDPTDLLDYMQEAVTSEHVHYHAEVVRAHALRRRLISACAEIAARCYSDDPEDVDLLAWATERVRR